MELIYLLPLENLIVKNLNKLNNFVHPQLLYPENLQPEIPILLGLRKKELL